MCVSERLNEVDLRQNKDIWVPLISYFLPEYKDTFMPPKQNIKGEVTFDEI